MHFEIDIGALQAQKIAEYAFCANFAWTSFSVLITSIVLVTCVHVYLAAVKKIEYEDLFTGFLIFYFAGALGLIIAIGGIIDCTIKYNKWNNNPQGVINSYVHNIVK